MKSLKLWKFERTTSVGKIPQTKVTYVHQLISHFPLKGSLVQSFVFHIAAFRKYFDRSQSVEFEKIRETSNALVRVSKETMEYTEWEEIQIGVSMAAVAAFDSHDKKLRVRFCF